MCVIYKCRPLINFQKSKALQRKQGKAIDRRAQHTHKYIYIYIYIYIHAVNSERRAVHSERDKRYPDTQ